MVCHPLKDSIRQLAGEVDQDRRRLDPHKQILTNSKMSCFSSSCRSSCRDRLRDTGAVVDSSGMLLARNVGVPSTVVTIGFRPPRSNSCADILRTGVVVPLLLAPAPAPTPPPLPDVPTALSRSLPAGDPRAFAPLVVPIPVTPPPPPPPQLLVEACDTSQASTMFRVAFLKREHDMKWRWQKQKKK